MKGEIQSLTCRSNHLSGLVLVGLCLRHKLPLSELNAVFPDFNLSWIESQLSQVMEDPAISRWYFENIDRFDKAFVGILTFDSSHPTSILSGDPAFLSTMSNDGRLAVPAMPVARRPIIDWLREKGHRGAAAGLDSIPASAHP